MLKTKNLVKKRSTHGLELYTKVAIAKGQLIIEYTSKKITTEKANQRGGQYLFELNDKYTTDGKDHHHLARYINHACHPNCYPEISMGEKHIYIYAKRNIKKGEELTYDYGKEFWNTYIKPKGCKCKKCCPQ